MILIYEPLCKGISHEKVNSGFLTGVCRANPNDEVVFVSDITHAKALQFILLNDEITLNNLKFKPINTGDCRTISGILIILFSLIRILILAKNSKNKKVLFLSYNSLILYSIKFLQLTNLMSNKIFFHFVLHGSFESINETSHNVSYSIPTQKTETKPKPFNPILIIKRSIRGLLNLFKGIKSQYQNFISQIVARLFKEKSALLFRTDIRYSFIALSDHIKFFASNYIDTEKINLKTITLPTNFSSIHTQKKENSFPKFAVFGFGNPTVLNQALNRLSGLDIKKKYEVVIISMDHRGSLNFKNITYVKESGQALSRSEMEEAALNVDFFLILYEEHKYNLSCSGSIMEALSYVKPIIHLKNPCIDHFNDRTEPIGYSLENPNQIADKMAEIANDFENQKPRILEFQKNIYKLRANYQIDSNLDKFRDLFN
jgi:hypothetical protein